MNFPIYGKIKNVPKHQPVYSAELTSNDWDWWGFQLTLGFFFAVHGTMMKPTWPMDSTGSSWIDKQNEKPTSEHQCNYIAEWAWQKDQAHIKQYLKFNMNQIFFNSDKHGNIHHHWTWFSWEQFSPETPMIIMVKPMVSPMIFMVKTHGFPVKFVSLILR